MKKSLILALSLAAAPIFAGEPAPVTVAPIVTPAPVCACPVSVELAAGYGLSNTDIYKGAESKEIDVYTFDITAVYAINDKHSVNLRFGYAFGDECQRVDYSSIETDVHTFTLMPGYRYTHALTEKTAAYIGANVGVANVSVKDCEDYPGYRFKSHGSDYGFAYSAEIGLRHEICENWALFATYMFCGSTAEPDVKGEYYTAPTHKQRYHVFRVGAAYEF